jgi:uncharacterized RDD family membrane protein YckC
MTVDRSASLVPGHVLAGYRIDGYAGRGGMGVVYRATQLALDRTVALKLVAPELAGDEGFRERFKRESRLAASIEHPNVIPIHEAGEADGQLFICMRFVEGTDLRELLALRGPLDPARAARIVSQVADALDAAHARGLVHRDVKPANVLIGDRGGVEHVYLTDFGLTKQTAGQSTLTQTGQWVGTLDYIAPEQIEGRAVDARTDVYALGCVLYQTLTGVVPFDRDSEVSKMWAHISEPPPRPSRRRPGIPQAFDAVVARAMAKDPGQRYGSAGELGRAARAAASGAAAPVSDASTDVGPPAPAQHPTYPPPSLRPPAPGAPAASPLPPPISPQPLAPPATAGPLAPAAAPAPPWLAPAEPRASYARRMLATLIDAFVVCLGATLIMLPFFAINEDLGVVVWLFLAPPLVALLCEVPFMARKGAHAGQSPGRQVLRLRVVTRDHGRASAGRCAVREALLKYFVFGGLSLLLLGLPLIANYLWPIWHGQGCALHDLAAKTRVVSAV